ncbi:flagellar basal body rod protein FlgB [Rhodobacteraceae bacterium RKSG542]|uniref:flagellar basal body rod protein FlgB n=1 Tax=Pseudovibrio flavus TaxID=2529854 RepID=UPI0012BCC7EF|nr:flagellar basal body rod protein FlgB [Pseudovibrio flavus]MTI19281.1 flagellar basal body rod protein FlgB [Pseudovibrio flavus]
MSIVDLPLFQALKQKMNWHQQRQGLLAQNIANADTPDYRGQDLKDFKFEGMVAQHTGDAGPARTHAGHIGGSAISGSGSAKGISAKSFERTPDGNSVVLEEQMMKVTENQMDYQMATSLYSRSLGLLRTALGR